MTKHITVELTDAQAAHLADLSEFRNAPIEALVVEAVQHQMDYDLWHEAEVQKGIDSADRGELLEHDAFLTEGRRIQAEIEARARRA